MGLTIASLFVGGNLGNIAGAGSDGVFGGLLTAANPTKVFLKGLAQDTDVLAVAEDGNAYTTESTEAQEDTADDMTLLPATPAVGDAYYIGHASKTFATLYINLTTQGVGTWTVTWEYWDGDSWTALSGVTDNTTGFTAATGFKSVVFTLPGDWAQAPVNDVYGYWVRGRVSAYSAVTTQPLGGQAYVVAADADATWTDDTTDFTDAGADDCAAMPTFPVVGDGLYVGLTGEKFCAIKMTIGTAGVATWTVTPFYYNGSAWGAVTTYEDDSAGFTTGTSTYYVHFDPPTDWASTTVNGTAGYFIYLKLTAFTSVTTQPLITQGWVLPVTTGATGMGVGVTGTITEVNSSAQTASASNADSKFILLNKTTGSHVSFTWTKAVAADSTTGLSLAVTANDEILLKQVTEDGSTEFANANFWFDIDT